MKASSVATAIFSLFPLLSLLGAVGDGGNVDFYRFPLTITWLLLTWFALWSKSYSRLLASIRHTWWLQPMVPFALFALSLGLTDIYMPHPWPKHTPPDAVTPSNSSSLGKRP